MANIDSEYAEYLKATAPDVVEQFDARYEDPEYALGLCKRCGSLIADAPVHNAYHRNLSLTLFVFGSTINSIVSLMSSENETEEELDGQTNGRSS